MSIVKEMRERQIGPPPPERLGVLATTLVGVVAFAVGALVIFGWKMLPQLRPPQLAANSPPAAAESTLWLTGNRLGRAGTAPLLRTCVNADVAGDMKPEAFLTVLQTAGTMSRLAPLVGATDFNDRSGLAENWRTIAECVYQQNSWHLCDADNRALAVESTSAFIRHAAHVASNAGKSREAQTMLSDNARARERIVEALQARVRNGYLVAADFGPMAPDELKRILSGTKTVANGCAKS